MAEDRRQRERLARWADEQGVDPKAKHVFLSLPSTAREEVRDMGSLKASNPSALLMARIRIIWPAFVELDEKARQECMNETGRRILDNRFEREKPLVWLVVRGESNPVGSGNEHI